MGAPTRESARHLEAFEYWWHGGQPLCYSEVAARFSVSTTAITSWARVFGWVERGAQRCQAASVRADEGAVADLSKVLTELRADARRLRAKITEALKGDGVNFTAADFDRIGRLELFLQGQPDSRSMTIADVTDEMLQAEIVRLQAEIAAGHRGAS
jgi:hypothetical protein